MENRLFDLARGASSPQGSGEASAAAGKGKKIRAPSPVLVREGREATGTVTTSAWTGEKKTKIETSTPATSSEDLGVVAMNIVHGGGQDEQEPEEIEGLDWDRDKLYKEIDSCLEWLRGRVRNDDDDYWVDPGEEYWALREQRLTAMNERLALYRIRAYEEDYRNLDDATLKVMYPPSLLEQRGYYKYNESSFDWYFDPQYCHNPDLQDYQRLVLRNDRDYYEDWEYYREALSTLESDQQFVQFWEKLSSKTKLIKLYLRDRSNELEKLLFYHALKIAAGFPHFPKALFHISFREFIQSVEYDDAWYKNYAEFFLDMWELIYKRKMNFKDVLRHIYKEGKYQYSILARESSLDIFEQHYKPYLDCIVEKARNDDDYLLIIESIKNMFPKRKRYHDYAKKKLDIAKEIGLIPLNSNRSFM